MIIPVVKIKNVMTIIQGVSTNDLYPVYIHKLFKKQLDRDRNCTSNNYIPSTCDSF